MKCEKFQGITTEEACLAQQRAKKILCQTCNDRLGGSLVTKKINEEVLSGLKTCRKCGNNKPFSEFYPDKKSKDGLRVYCKPCTAALTREYQQKKKESEGKPIKKQRAKKGEIQPVNKKQITEAELVPKLISAFKETQDQALNLFAALNTLKQFGADFEMPEWRTIK
jgi:hypothetical protein